MISSKADYLFYLAADQKSLRITRRSPKILGDSIWKFQRTLRKYEYYTNCKTKLLYIPLRMWLRYRYMKLSSRMGFTIPINRIGPGLSIAHRGPIIINGGTVIGKNCRIHVCVNIGASARNSEEVPTIGDNVYIGPGVKMYGDIRIADNIAIGANAVVTKSFPDPGVSIAGVPARVISHRGSGGMLVRGA